MLELSTRLFLFHFKENTLHAINIVISLLKRIIQVIMMCGLPCSGKTTWAVDHMNQNRAKHYHMIGNECIMDRLGSLFAYALNKSVGIAYNNVIEVSLMRINFEIKFNQMVELLLLKNVPCRYF